jgi:hypothetical protein
MLRSQSIAGGWLDGHSMSGSGESVRERSTVSQKKQKNRHCAEPRNSLNRLLPRPAARFSAVFR